MSFAASFKSIRITYPVNSTTNHLERLDPALSRPGRMDVWIEFKNASKWQCEALFRNFFPSSEDYFSASSVSSSVQGCDADVEDMDIPGLTCEVLGSSPSSTSISSGSGTSSESKEKTPKTSGDKTLSPGTGTSPVNPAFPPPPPRKTRTNALLDPATLARLAKTFAEAIPEGEFSVAALQGCEYSKLLIPSPYSLLCLFPCLCFFSFIQVCACNAE